MPDNTPRRGYPYPLPDDAIADYPALGRSLAEILDGEIQVPPGNATGDVLVWNGNAWVPVAGIANVAGPVVTQAPTIVGAVNSGSTVARGPGVWTGNPTPAITWEWLIDNVQVQAGGDNYLIPGDATGKTLKLREAASNSFGSSSSEVTSGIAVGIKGAWEATRSFLDFASYDWWSLPWAGVLPDNAGDEPTAAAVLVQDQWGIGLIDAIALPAAGTYRFEFSASFPDNWTHGSSGGLEFVGTRILVNGAAYSEVVDGNRDPSRSVDVAGLTAGMAVAFQFKGSAQGKAPRPNNIRLRITHLG